MKDMQADRGERMEEMGMQDGGWAVETETNGRPMNTGWKKKSDA